MNIFMLSYDVERCAQYHNNKHCVKMILEYAQLLSAAHHLNNNSIKDKLYKLSHTNHPSTVWVLVVEVLVVEVLAVEHQELEVIWFKPNLVDGIRELVHKVG
jgi:hypothetical protein